MKTAIIISDINGFIEPNQASQSNLNLKKVTTHFLHMIKNSNIIMDCGVFQLENIKGINADIFVDNEFDTDNDACKCVSPHLEKVQKFYKNSWMKKPHMNTTELMNSDDKTFIIGSKNIIEKYIPQCNNVIVARFNKHLDSDAKCYRDMINGFEFNGGLSLKDRKTNIDIMRFTL